MSDTLPSLDVFSGLFRSYNIVPIFRRLTGDQLTPVLAYRRMVRPDGRLAPSFLLESVIGGAQIARYSYLGAQPTAQIIARGHEVTYRDTLNPARSGTFSCDDPLSHMKKLTADWRLAPVEGLPAFTGGWVGYAGYDAVRYLESEKLSDAPPDDRGLPDLHLHLYRDIVAFDHVQKTIIVITHVGSNEYASPREAYAGGVARLDRIVESLETPVSRDTSVELPMGRVDLDSAPRQLPESNMGREAYEGIVDAAKQYISAGDIFQVVLSQRFDLSSSADPFDVYRALRIVNPSPYMFYVQVEGAILIGSSPEILCRVQDREVTSRPLAGTRRRGSDPQEDTALESELLADPKERAEHVMLVDLGRNDVGRVAKPGSIDLPQVMVVERYSHVMHISSSVTGHLRNDLDCWDALRHTLPVGTVSGAPKVRAMQIIDELEAARRGPYAGAVGYADFAGNMDMAIALRTIVALPPRDGGAWNYHVQAGAGVVADSVPANEHRETVNKAAALAKAIDLAEKAFGPGFTSGL